MAPVLEVERRFRVSPSQVRVVKDRLLSGGRTEQSFVSGARVAGTIGRRASTTIRDEYFDDGKFTLTLADLWLRRRDRLWELKAPAMVGAAGASAVVAAAASWRGADSVVPAASAPADSGVVPPSALATCSPPSDEAPSYLEDSGHASYLEYSGVAHTSYLEYSGVATLCGVQRGERSSAPLSHNVRQGGAGAFSRCSGFSRPTQQGSGGRAKDRHFLRPIRRRASLG